MLNAECWNEEEKLKLNKQDQDEKRTKTDKGSEKRGKERRG